MKAFKELSQNQLIGLLTLVFVVVLGFGMYLAQNPGVDTEFDESQTPPIVQIDAGYNATLSGEPFYVVDDNDEDFDDSLDVCNEFGTDRFRRDVQNGWYQVVAYEDGLTVEEVIFEQIDLQEGDRMVAVLYDADDQEWKAWPNRIIVDENGNNVDLLDRDETLSKGTVIAVSADVDVDYCADYDEVGDHDNIELRWNLVSKPDFDDVDYRTIWEVAFAKGGNSGVDLDRYYSSDDPANSELPNQLSNDQLYWVYGGEAGNVTEGEDLPDEPLTCTEYEIRVTADYSNYTPADPSTENLEANVGNSLDEQPWLYATYDNFDEYNENLQRLLGEGAVVEGKCAPEVSACTDEVRPGMILTVRNQSGDLIKNAEFLVTINGAEADRQQNSDNSGSADVYTLLDTSEVTGLFTVSVLADGYLSQDVAIEVEEDDCNNIVTVERTIILKDDAKPLANVTVSVVDQNGDPISLGLLNIVPTAGSTLEVVDGSMFRLVGAVEDEFFLISSRDGAATKYATKTFNVNDRDASGNLTAVLDEESDRDLSSLDKDGIISFVELDRNGSTFNIVLNTEFLVKEVINTKVLLVESTIPAQEGENGQLLGSATGSDLNIDISTDNRISISTDSLSLANNTAIGLVVAEEAILYDDNGTDKTNYTYYYTEVTDESLNLNPETIQEAQEAQEQQQQQSASDVSSTETRSLLFEGGFNQTQTLQGIDQFLYEGQALEVYTAQ